MALLLLLGLAAIPGAAQMMGPPPLWMMALTWLTFLAFLGSAGAAAIFATATKGGQMSLVGILFVVAGLVMALHWGLLLFSSMGASILIDALFALTAIIGSLCLAAGTFRLYTIIKALG